MDYLLPMSLAILAVIAYILGRRDGAASVRTDSTATGAPMEAELRRQLEQARADAASAAVEGEAKRQRDMTLLKESLKDSFTALSTETLTRMAPALTESMRVGVAPMITEVKIAMKSQSDLVQLGQRNASEQSGRVQEGMMQLKAATDLLSGSTNDFTAVLKSSSHRGTWGEQTLRRVIEVSGLSIHCDFQEQVKQGDSKPDCVVLLPNDRCVVIDSKVPEFDATLGEPEAPNRKDFAKALAVKLMGMIKDLSGRGYPEKCFGDKQNSVPFPHVILFLPAESLLSAALEGDPELLIKANKEKILLATPATLLAFLVAIEIAWIQHSQAKNAEEIADASAELYKRVDTLVGHLDGLRSRVAGVVDYFNKMVGSYEGSVRPQGDRVLKLRGAVTEDPLPEVEQVVEPLRMLNSSPDAT